MTPAVGPAWHTLPAEDRADLVGYLLGEAEEQERLAAAHGDVGERLAATSRARANRAAVRVLRERGSE